MVWAVGDGFLSEGPARLVCMFDVDAVLEASLTLADSGASPLDRVRAAGRLRAVADAAEAQAVVDLADAHGWSHTDRVDVFGSRPLLIGADGAEPIDESIVSEIAVAQQTSVGAATWFVRDCVNLHARHPFTWAAVQDGRARLWQARKVAQACADAGLSAQQALAADERVQPAWHKLGWKRVSRLARAAMMIAAPAVMAEQAARKGRDRFCDTTPVADDPDAAWITAKLDTADATFLDATIERLAGLLADEGDTDEKNHRRAKALGILATPARALALLGPHCRRGLHDDAQVPDMSRLAAESALPGSRIFVHLHADTLTAGVGVARVEDAGPILLGQLARWVGHTRIKLTPVLHADPAAEPAVDAYEIPDRIREAVIGRDQWEMFPFSTREARGLDIDHTAPWRPGKPGQTRPSNLGCLTRRAHRLKTHAGWELLQTAPGTFWWRTPLGQIIRVGPDGTTVWPPDTTPTPWPDDTS